MLTISSGHSADYLTGAVATGRENYYTGAVAAGEPPGRWYGAGATALGLAGEVDTQDMTALYERFIDPRDPAFRDPSSWDEASTLGHTGRRYLSEEELYRLALDAEPDADAERREQLRLDAGKRARRNVSFLDATFSVQKSVTVLHTAFEAQQVAAERAATEAAEKAEAARQGGDAIAAAMWERRQADAHIEAGSWSAHRQAVEDAVWAGNCAALDYLAEHAGYSRVGHHGGSAGRFVDAHDWVVASFFQHDSRDHDPQLHIHNAILNRVQGPDGAWRTLDSRAVHKFRGAAAAVGERTTESHLAASLGVQFAMRPDGKAREVVGIPTEVMDLFSSRRRAITRKTAELVEAFQTQFGREPNALELDRLARQATFATRRAKTHEGESTEQRLARWDRELRAEIAGGLAQVARDALTHTSEAGEPVPWSPAAVIETALAAVQEKKAAWTAPDLTREISDALPDHVGTLTGEQTARLLNTLTGAALELAVPLDAPRPGDDDLPADLRLANGNSAYQAPGGALYATPDHVHTERALTTATHRGGAPVLAAGLVDTVVADLAERGVTLGVDQAAAVRGVLTSGAATESLVGPAGTGKSLVVGAIAHAWQDPSLWDGTKRRAFGLATSQIATDVLAGEGVTARNITRWLATQDRLTTNPSGDDHRWRLAAGDLVVVDESSMVDTNHLAAIHEHVSAAGAKLLLVGDHHQLAAVGAGGGMDLLATAGASYELTEARRFTQPWERAASLRLRAADESVLTEYHRHGRLIDGGTLAEAEQSAARAWLADTLDGKRSLLLVDTNDQAAALSAQLRAELVRLGQVAEHGVPLGLQNTYAGVGDIVQARRNEWNLAGQYGNTVAPINRQQYRVIETHDDGSIVVDTIPAGDQPAVRLTLPAGYVSEHLALGYASTVHAAEGITVDTAHPVVTPSTQHAALYVMLTRGRDNNTAHVATTTRPADAPTGDVVHRNPAAVLAGAFATADQQHSALAIATRSIENADSVRTAAELLADAAEIATAGRTTTWLDQLVDDGHLTSDQRARIAAEDGATTLTRVLRRAEVAGHDPYRVLTDVIADRPLAGSRQLTNVIHHRITESVQLDPHGDTFTEWTPRVDNPEWQTYLDTLARAADERRHELAHQVATDSPQWAVEAFGPVPTDDAERAVWLRNAGVVAAHRDLSGHDDPAVALGGAPKRGQVEAYASWRAAWRALDLPEVGRDELEMSTGQLRVRVRAYDRETTWAPKYVGEELAGTHQAAATHRQTAAIRRVEADTAADPVHRERLTREAAEAEALADALDHRAADLAEADESRAAWLTHTAATRAAAERAEAELSARSLDAVVDERLVTAEEWLAAHRADQAAEDPYRPVHEADVVDPAEAVVDEGPVANEHTAVTGPVETGVADIRDTASSEQKLTEHEQLHVPTVDETQESISRARRALAEIRAREAADAESAAEEAHADQLARWHTHDEHEHIRETDRSTDLAGAEI